MALTTLWHGEHKLLAVFAMLCLPIAAIDILAGSQICPWGLYLLPVVLAGWLCGWRQALALTLIVSAFMIASAVLSGHPYDIWWEFALSLCSRVASLVTAGYLASAASGSATLNDTMTTKHIVD
jgi:hypothetical protein